MSGRREGGEEVESAGSFDCVCVGRGRRRRLCGGTTEKPPHALVAKAPALCGCQQDPESTGTFGSSAGSDLPDWPGLGSWAAAGTHDAHPRGQRDQGGAPIPEPWGAAEAPGAHGRGAPGTRAACDLAEAWAAGRSCLAPGGLQGSGGPGRPGRAPRAPAVRLGAGTRSRPPRAATSRMGPRCSPGQSGSSPRRDLSRRLPLRFPGSFLPGATLGLLSLKTPQKHKPEARLGTLPSRRKPMGNGSSFAIALILELPKSYAICSQPD